MANAASVFQLTSANIPSTGPAEFVFDWNGDLSGGIDSFTFSTPDTVWEIRLNTNPRHSSPTNSISVKPIHDGNPDALVKSLNLIKLDGSPNDRILYWTVPHPSTGPGHYDSFTFQYLSVSLSGGDVMGAQLRLTAQHVTAAPVPVPAAVWLFGTGLIAMAGLGRLRRGKVSHDDPREPG